MAKSVQRGRIGRGVLPKSSWPWEDWLDALWDRKQKFELDLFKFLPEEKSQAALRRQFKPGDQLEAKRFPRLAPVKYNRRLTKRYLATTPKKIRVLEREYLECLLILHALKPRGILGGIRVYPAGKTAAQLKKKKIGRPTKHHRPMTPAERQREKRGQAVFQLHKYSGGILPDVNPEPPLPPPPVPWGPWSSWSPPGKPFLPWLTIREF